MNPIDDDAFANFAAVVFAAAENHDFAYGKKTVTTDTTEDNSVSKYKSSTSCLPIIKQFWGTTATSTIKKEPVLNIANSRLFKRRAEQRQINDVT
jgi:hypothetical protein